MTAVERPIEDVPSHVGSAPSPHVGYHASKRLIDITVALLVLVITSPISLIAALGIMIESGGPVLFRQERLGLRGNRFHCFKFRTMVHDAERRIHEAMATAQDAGPDFKRASDPRVTRLGRLLRTWSVDELPQLLNVLRGQMSIVGPRPIAVWEGPYQGYDWERLGVKPGLTCTWQVSGRSEIGWDRRMMLDVEYVRTRSLRRDIAIMLRTPLAILSRRGAV